MNEDRGRAIWSSRGNRSDKKFLPTYVNQRPRVLRDIVTAGRIGLRHRYDPSLVSGDS